MKLEGDGESKLLMPRSQCREDREIGYRSDGSSKTNISTKKEHGNYKTQEVTTEEKVVGGGEKPPKKDSWTVENCFRGFESRG